MEPSRPSRDSAGQGLAAAHAASLGALVGSTARGIGGLAGLAVGLGAGARLLDATVGMSQLPIMTSPPEPDLEAVPESPEFSAAWLTAAFRRSGLLPPGVHVRELSVGEIKLEVEGDADILNGGGLAGGRTVRVSGISYSGGEGLPSSLIQKWCSSHDIVPWDLGGRLWQYALFGGPGYIDRELVVYRDVLPQLAQAGVRSPGGARPLADALSRPLAHALFRRATSLTALWYGGLDGGGRQSGLEYVLDRGSSYVRTRRRERTMHTRVLIDALFKPLQASTQAHTLARLALERLVLLLRLALLPPVLGVADVVVCVLELPKNLDQPAK